MNEGMITEDVEKTRGLDIESIEELKETMEDDLHGESIEDSDKLTLKENLQTLEGVITEQDVKSYSEYLESLNFIELMKAKREMTSYTNTMKGMKQTTESLMELKENMGKVTDELAKDTDDTIADDIHVSNMEDDMEWKDAETFLEHYDESMDNLQRIQYKVNELLKKFDEIPKTTAYLTNSMMEVIDKNLKKIEELGNPSCYIRAKKFYLTQKNIFSHRDSIDYLVSKVSDKKGIVRNLMRSIKEDRKKGKKDTITSVQKNVTKTFTKIFSVDQLNSFENYLVDLYDSKDKAFYVQYALYLFYSNEKKFGKYGNHKWVEVVIMNVLDILTDKYDLETGVDHFNNELLKLRDACL